MTERKPHPDNDLIDQAEENSMPSAQATRAGGEVNRRVGTRAELNAALGTLDGDKVERAVGSDNPEEDAKKGDKTIAAMQDDRNS